jgi:2-C-methyl-D-erythritol 2,4-cyclodiphosphate synthase
MSDQRIGLGVDVHPFLEEGTDPGERVLVLGGVHFPGERPLVGHSDADAVAHAVGDAILGAAGLGDLGMHFPDSDPVWKGADSLTILAGCVALAKEAGWKVVNADCTVVTERPKVAPVRDEMIARLSAVAGAPIHVKATRPEGLGTLGRVEGIACLAVVLLGQ